MTPHRATAASSTAAIGPGVGIVVHSHLRWDFVWQRPQQLLSRLAATNPVLFVEEPVTLADITTATLKLSTPFAGVTRAVPQLPVWASHSSDDATVVVR